MRSINTDNLVNKWRKVTVLLHTGGQGHTSPSIPSHPIPCSLTNTNNHECSIVNVCVHTFLLDHHGRTTRRTKRPTNKGTDRWEKASKNCVSATNDLEQRYFNYTPVVSRSLKSAVIGDLGELVDAPDDAPFSLCAPFLDNALVFSTTRLCWVSRWLRIVEVDGFLKCFLHFLQRVSSLLSDFRS